MRRGRGCGLQLRPLFLCQLLELGVKKGKSRMALILWGLLDSALWWRLHPLSILYKNMFYLASFICIMQIYLLCLHTNYQRY